MSPNELADRNERRRRRRSTLLDCDPDQLGELLRLHGVSGQACQKLKSKLQLASFQQQCPASRCLGLSDDQVDGQVLSSALHLTLSGQEARHLMAIVKFYRTCPYYEPKEKVRLALDSRKEF